MTNSLADIVVKATPGEWFLAEDLEPEGGCLSRGLMAPDSFVAHVLFDDEEDTQAVANAELLVRAKSLATLVLEAREALQSIADLGSDGEHSGDRHARCRDIARATLAKLEAL